MYHECDEGLSSIEPESYDDVVKLWSGKNYEMRTNSLESVSYDEIEL